ncbi:MAG TPA: heme-binding beta-barrel domain-containing protein [Acidimicrobiia bacterium]|nr:heme-binding beta-barrel domain-containing protein [Acidimicrobiia bacterium]
MTETAHDYGVDIYTEAVGDDDTLANLGPLAPLAGTWRGVNGADEHPVAEGTERDGFDERYELEPIDRQTNGPQLFYGLRYHTHIVKPGEIETFHDQVGYWLWEPATSTITLTLAIPRGQVLLAGGAADADAREFEVNAAVGSETYGILSNPFLDRSFRTLSYRMHVTVHDDGKWSYEEEGVLEIPGRDEPFKHVDHNTLTRIAPSTTNPLATPRRNDGSLGIGSLRPARGA